MFLYFHVLTLILLFKLMWDLMEHDHIVRKFVKYIFDISRKYTDHLDDFYPSDQELSDATTESEEEQEEEEEEEQEEQEEEEQTLRLRQQQTKELQSKIKETF